MREGAKKSVGRFADFAFVALSVAATGWALGHLLHYRYGRDHEIYHVIVEEMLHGGVPYRDAWDIKPPGIFFLFALARSLGDGETAVRILEAVGWGSLPYAWSLLTRRYAASRLAGLLAGSLACVTYVQLEFWSTAQPEGFAAVALTWAIVLGTWQPSATTAQARPKQLAAWVAVGALYGVAFLMKPPAAGGMCVTAWFVLRQCARTDRRSAAGAMSIGVAAPLVLTLGYFARAGALGDLWDTLFVFVPRYTGIGFEAARFNEYFVRALSGWLVGFSGVSALGLALALSVRPPAASTATDDRALIGHVLGVAVFPLLGVALQAKFFTYHYATAIALGSGLAGYGLWKGWRYFADRLPLLAPVYLALVVAMIDFDPDVPGVPGDWASREKLRYAWIVAPSDRRREIEDALYRTPDFLPERNREAAAWVASHTSPRDRILVFGRQPAVYRLAKRRPASRYFFNVPQRANWDAPRYRARMMEDLARHSPAAILVEIGDRHPIDTGNSGTSRDALAGFPELARLLSTYQASGGNGRFQYFLGPER
jgi:hypothetical protein